MTEKQGAIITLEELKTIELSVLKDIHAICIKENFRYSMCGGTLLGAVRHQGFIPWDDDIDIVMPRPDYEKFIEYCQTHETPFELLCNKTNSNYGYLFAKAMAKNTVIIEEDIDVAKIPMGVYVDIFPVDGLGQTLEEARKNFKTKRFARELLVAANWKHFFRSKTKAWYYEPIRFAFFLLSRFVSKKRLVDGIEKYYSKWNFDDAKFVACVCGMYRTREITIQESYTQIIDMKFEGEMFCGLKNYDECLTRFYGNYMELPPEEKRKTHHSFVAYKKQNVEE
jgi:lipopolysaccharide cholinephosphotransferase